MRRRESIRNLVAWCFVVWLIVWVFIEVKYGSNLDLSYWVIMLVVFVFLEGIGIFTTQKGDTFSELVWSITKVGKARDPIGIGIALALGTRLLYVFLEFKEVVNETTRIWFDIGPIMLLIIGVTLWMVSHFKDEGKTG